MFCFVLLSFIIMASSETSLAPSLFLNHGGGPFPVLGEKNNLEIAECLKNTSILVDLSRLKAIIVVTAHREEDIVTISSGSHHNLLYDYNNFPPESYKYIYEAPGHPEIARELNVAFENAGIPSRLDSERGWDHGVFIPMMLINPKADIPVIQVSILKNQNSEQHYEIGQVLYQFRKKGIAVFGSGMSYHNMKEFSKKRPVTDNVVVNEYFDKFLNDVCTGDVGKRRDIVSWEQIPGGLESHPKGEADHLMPLIVNAGAGGSRPGKKVFDSVFLRKFRLSAYIWEE